MLHVKRYIIRQLVPHGKTTFMKEEYSKSFGGATSYTVLGGVKWFSADKLKLPPKNAPALLTDPLPQRMVCCWMGKINYPKNPIMAVIYLVEDPVKQKAKPVNNARATLAAILERDAALLPPTPGEGLLTTIAHNGIVVAIHWRKIPGGSSQLEAHAITIPLTMARALAKKEI